MQQSPTVLTDARIATIAPPEPGAARSPYGLIDDGAVALRDGRISWVGRRDDLPREFRSWAQEALGGRLLTPALVDCHTHLVHGGHRAVEFEMRLEGASYEAIAKAGGGIRSTMTATRESSEQGLLDAALTRVDALIAEGVATVEVKSGYGLDMANERKMLQVARRIAATRPVNVRSTFLGAHALPPEYEHNADGYIDYMAGEVLPSLAGEGLVDAVDAFCENIGFSPAQVARVFDAAASLGLPVKLHAEQLSDLKGARLAAGYRALSVDHLEHLAPQDIAPLAASGTVAVLLPGAFYCLRETRVPPVDALAAAAVPIAVATDLNPGSSPLGSLLLAANMACTLFRLTPEQSLAGVTRNAALALGLGESRGTVEAGKRADLACWEVEHPAELCYRIGSNPLYRRYFGGPDPVRPRTTHHGDAA